MTVSTTLQFYGKYWDRRQRAVAGRRWKNVILRTPIRQIYGNNALVEARYRQIEEDLRKFAFEEMRFEFDPNGTHLFSIMELRQSYARRSVDFLESIYLLLEADKIVPAAIIGRSLIETVAMGSLFLSEMKECVQSANLERLELRLARFFAGITGRDPKPIHVMDAMRDLDKLNADYVKYLDDKHGLFSAFEKMLHPTGEGGQTEKYVDMLSMMRVYDALSEIAHPNGTGVHYLYPDPQNEDDRVKDTRNYYRQLAVSATWQCRHLLRALEETKDLPGHYRSNVGMPSTPRA